MVGDAASFPVRLIPQPYSACRFIWKFLILIVLSVLIFKLSLQLVIIIYSLIIFFYLKEENLLLCSYFVQFTGMQQQVHVQMECFCFVVEETQQAQYVAL